MEPITVSQLNRYVKNLISIDENLRSITIKGEISNFTNHIKTGHFYFTLKDNNASIRAIMFKSNASKVKFEVENGMNVIIKGSVQVFERDGLYQLYCDTLEPDGIGALYLAFEQLKEKLSKQGLFDDEHKKDLPLYPQKIGIVTSKTGAALQDIINILSRRYPVATVVLIPALVQGENAPLSIVDGIKAAQKNGDIDVLIVGRGGGSIEDLWAFNDERVARAIYDCSIPVISAVGHEIDFTISDFVADLRAPTPSAAAELCSPNIETLYHLLNTQKTMMSNYIISKINQNFEKLATCYKRLNLVSPIGKVKTMEADNDAKIARLNLAFKRLLEQKEEMYKKQVEMLEALSPLKVITRGYSITFSDDIVLSSIKQINQGDMIKTKLSDGEIISEITDIKKSNLRKAKKL